MIEIRTIKDINSYETKLVGPFTGRQALCLAIAVPVGWKLYAMISPFVSTDVATSLLFIPAVIAYLFGWYKPYGMPLEKFLRSIFVTTVLAPSHRVYKTVNRQEAANDYLSELDGLMTDMYGESTQKSQTPKHKKCKYKISKKAVL